MVVEEETGVEGVEKEDAVVRGKRPEKQHLLFLLLNSATHRIKLVFTGKQHPHHPLEAP